MLIYMYFNTYAGFIIISVLVLLILMVVIWKIIDATLNSKTPEVTMEATVMSKRFQKEFNSRQGWKFKFFVEFRLEDGYYKEMKIPHYVYDALYENQKGKLTFKRNRYISFDTRDEMPEHERVDKEENRRYQK